MQVSFDETYYVSLKSRDSLGIKVLPEMLSNEFSLKFGDSSFFQEDN